MITEHGRTRGISFTALIAMLLIMSGFTLMRSLRALGDTAAGSAGDPLAPASIGLAVCFIVCAGAALLWKRWGLYGFIAFGSLGAALYLAQGAYNALVMPLLALMTVLISVLTKEWGGMR